MKKTLFLISFLIISLFSCKTIEQIPQDKTAAQIIQMGQNYLSSGNYTSAEYCYQTALERYSDNPDILVEVKYELGNVYLKQKKYSLFQRFCNTFIQFFTGQQFSSAISKNSFVGSIL